MSRITVYSDLCRFSKDLTPGTKTAVLQNYIFRGQNFKLQVAGE